MRHTEQASGSRDTGQKMSPMNTHDRLLPPAAFWISLLKPYNVNNNHPQYQEARSWCFGRILPVLQRHLTILKSTQAKRLLIGPTVQCIKHVR
jgi:hypothetical protein